MRTVFCLLLAALLLAPAPAAAETDVRVNINVGVPAPPLPPPPLPGPPQIFFNAPPLFLAPPRLGFYIGVDMPYDLVLISGSYYLFHGNHWYRSRHYNGPWVVTRYEQLPPSVRKHKLEKIRYHREHEYRAYHDHRDQYRGRHYRPGKDPSERRKSDKGYHKEYKHRDDDDRRHHKGRGRGNDD